MKHGVPEQSATEATIHHLENANIATTEKNGYKTVKSKVMLDLFFIKNGIVHMEFITECATINKTRYKKTLDRLSDLIHPKCS